LSFTRRRIQRQHGRLGGQQLDDDATKGLRQRGPSDRSPYPLAGGIDVGDGRLTLDALDASHRDAGALGDVEPGVAGST
jgi:hypothetical protein